MEKLNNITLYCIISILIIGGCNDLLNEEKITTPPIDTYYKTADGFGDLVNSTYSKSQWLFQGSYPFLVFFGTDLWINGSDGTYLGYSAYNSAINPSNDILWGLWSNFYEGIAACNTAISRSDEVADLSEDEIKSKVAEAYFLRAWYYHILVQQFGGVPLKIEEVTEVETTASRATEEEVYNQIISDLKFAEENLPVEPSNVGRATKPAAEALLARVYLILHQYENSATYAEKVINSYNFTLLNDYANLWVPGNQDNAESIWTIHFSEDHRLNEYANTYFLYWTPRYDYQPGMKRALENDRPWPRFLATRFYLDLLTSNRDNDSRYEKSWKDVWIANNSVTLPSNMQIGDTAFTYRAYSVSEEVEESKPYPVLDINDLYDGETPKGALELFPHMRKYRDPNRTSINSGAGTKDVMEIRLAEIYLVAAEALMMQNKSSEGVKYINAVRRRAAWEGKESQMEINSNQLTMEFILNERARELGGERLRWYDLKRTNELMDRVNKYNFYGKSNIKEFNRLRPIPTQMIERLTNREDFEQNPGY